MTSLPDEQGVSVCEAHAKHGIASGAVVPPGFSFCVVCENERLRQTLNSCRNWLTNSRIGTYTYMESPDFYTDKTAMVDRIDEVLRD